MCNCATEINAELAQRNGRLVNGFSLGKGEMEFFPVMIEVEKMNTRGKKPPRVLASFCPFCGEKYRKDAA